MSENSNKPTDQSKREFFTRGTAAAAAVTVAPGVVLYNIAQAARDPGTPVSSENRWGMLVDANKCANGCTACVDACHEENNVHGHDRELTDAQWIRKVTLRDRQTGHESNIPVMCQHCETAPCADVCPTGASFKRADGIVLVDKHICIGCRYCMMACPFKARSFIHEDVTDQAEHAPRGKGTVEACTLCVHRVDDGRQPACVEACAGAEHGALIFGDLNDPNSNISQELKKYPSRHLRADLALNQGVRYRNI